MVSNDLDPLNKKLIIRTKNARPEATKIIRIEFDKVNKRPKAKIVATVNVPKAQCLLHTRAEITPIKPIIVSGHPSPHRAY